MLDLSRVQFLCTNPLRHGDGSFKFEVILVLPALDGSASRIVGTADVMVASDQACGAIGRALEQIATQLPPELAMPQ